VATRTEGSSERRRRRKELRDVKTIGTAIVTKRTRKACKQVNRRVKEREPKKRTKNGKKGGRAYKMSGPNNTPLLLLGKRLNIDLGAQTNVKNLKTRRSKKWGDQKLPAKHLKSEPISGKKERKRPTAQTPLTQGQGAKAGSVTEKSRNLQLHDNGQRRNQCNIPL